MWRDTKHGYYPLSTNYAANIVEKLENTNILYTNYYCMVLLAPFYNNGPQNIVVHRFLDPISDLLEAIKIDLPNTKSTNIINNHSFAEVKKLHNINRRLQIYLLCLIFYFLIITFCTSANQRLALVYSSQLFNSLDKCMIACICIEKFCCSLCRVLTVDQMKNWTRHVHGWRLHNYRPIINRSIENV